MTAKQRSILVPSYIKTFSCIGSACEDTCCRGWRISVDHDTYKKYTNLANKEIKQDLKKHIKRNRSTPSKKYYAKINLNASGDCPLLNEQKLCSIQEKLGEDYLSVTCSTYPRITNQVNNTLEKSATMSCPEAARLALLNTERIEFEEIAAYTTTLRDEPSKKIDTMNRDVNQIEHHFWDLRIFTIQVIQNRHYSLTDRLIILGMFYQKLQEYVNEKKIEYIPQLIASYTTMMEKHELDESLSTIPALTTIQMKLVKELTDLRLFKGGNHERYMQCFKEMLIGINYTVGNTIENISVCYQEAHDTYYLPFMKKHDYILENYLVHYVFKNLFPINRGKHVFDEYVLFIVHYAMIKLHLIGMAGYYKKEFSPDHVIRLIQSFSRVVEHNHSYLREIEKLLTENGFTTMAFMAILIKN
ncbi:flagellin lysine-N-methylase [Bacillus chungangensis]|uniref:Lysine-N-methylase n=1 Tax=Bacillus chungangensis TaxID=587633 RepID=A0ABT9WUV1_9BACI|nr:flagellin lysine-N-methylase [Bacillus chungangensis]MDQ0177081.1 lysine-N-methylase [Bacillus chungangensis]